MITEMDDLKIENELQQIRDCVTRFPNIPEFRDSGPYPSNKSNEGADKYVVPLIPKKSAPSDLWSKYCCYTIEAGQQIRFGTQNLNGLYFIGFSYNPSRKECAKEKYLFEVQHVLRNAVATLGSDDFLFFNRARLASGEDSKYLFIWKGFYEFSPERIANDLKKLIEETFPHLEKMTGSPVR